MSLFPSIRNKKFIEKIGRASSFLSSKVGLRLKNAEINIIKDISTAASIANVFGTLGIN